MRELSSALHFLGMTAMPFRHCLLKYAYAMPNTICKPNSEVENLVQTNLFGVGDGSVWHSLWMRSCLDLGMGVEAHCNYHWSFVLDVTSPSNPS